MRKKTVKEKTGKGLLRAVALLLLLLVALPLAGCASLRDTVASRTFRNKAWAQRTMAAYIQEKYGDTPVFEAVELVTWYVGERGGISGYRARTAGGYCVSLDFHDSQKLADTRQSRQILDDIHTMLQGNSLSPQYVIPGDNPEYYSEEDLAEMEGGLYFNTYYDREAGLPAFFQQVSDNGEWVPDFFVIFRDPGALTPQAFRQKVREKINPLFAPLRVECAVYKQEYYDGLVSDLASGDEERVARGADGFCLSWTGHYSLRLVAVDNFDEMKCWAVYTGVEVDGERQFQQQFYGDNTVEILPGVTVALVQADLLELNAEEFTLRKIPAEAFAPPPDGFVYASDFYQLVRHTQEDCSAVAFTVDLARFFPGVSALEAFAAGAASAYQAEGPEDYAQWNVYTEPEGWANYEGGRLTWRLTSVLDDPLAGAVCLLLPQQKAAQLPGLPWPDLTGPVDFEAPENWQGAHPKALAQGWCAQPALGALLPARYLFLEDGTFCYTADEYTADQRVRYCDGSWEYQDGVLTLTVKRKLVVEGGRVNSNLQGGSRNKIIEGGTLTQVTLAPEAYETMEISLTVPENPLEGTPYEDLCINGVIELDGTMFYAVPAIGYGDIPTYWEDYEYGP